MVNAPLKSRNRLFALGVLLALSFGAAGRNVAQEERAGRQEWPKEIDAGTGRITIYEPQLESLKGPRLSTRAAISMVPEGSTEPVFGAIWLEATLTVDEDGKTAQPENFRIAEMRFPGGDRLPSVRDAVGTEILRWKLTYSMDSLLAELRQLEERKASAAALKADVPEINFRSHPAVMVTLDGEPEWRAVAGTGLQRLANSSFFVVEERDGGKCYLRISPFWWSAESALGPWEAVDDAPDAVEALWSKEPRPEIVEDDDGEEDRRRPEVITSTRPAELVWTDGLPQYAPIAGADLLYVKNTTSDVFIEISTQNSYVLLSGRWYRTASSKVAWEFVPADQLPADFRRIPIGSEKQHVLACVAGTPQAREALKNAEIPQTEAVKPGPAPELQATYDGEPRFTEISDSPVRYAVNTPSPIFNVERRYYWCESGIWYDSDYAVGPWAVCTWVPRPIYLIPPSCPFYYVTYCRIFSVSPYSISFGYYPGYRGCYPWGPTVVYGTGWRYRGWVGTSCYVRPSTWGLGVRYSTSACSWTFGLGWGSSSAWCGVGYTRRSPSIVVGVGGGCNVRSVAGYRNSVGVDVVTPVRSPRCDNLYVRQPDRIVRPIVPRDDHEGPRRPPIVKDPPRREPPVAPPPGREPPRVKDPVGSPRDHPGSRDLHPRDPDRGPQDNVPRIPRRPDRDSDDDVRPRDVPRVKDPTPTPRDPRPREDDPRTRRGEDREPPKPPPPVERRDPPRQPPPVERREPPREPPRQPPPVERREPPRQPPPPVERRDPPRQPPPVERREPPRQPPPVERRDPPRSPPPPQERHRDSGSSDRGSDRRR